MKPNRYRQWIATVKEVITNGPIKQEIFLERLSDLRERIEIWCNKFGYEQQDNYAERKNAEGEIVWHKTDWSYVDDMHNTVYNSHHKREGEDGFGNDYSYNDETLKRFNKMWRKYEV
tara:strand:+ start:126 stop:476 length:351 start_codon:yes stop_codon:yes gene_type:complete